MSFEVLSDRSLCALAVFIEDDQKVTRLIEDFGGLRSCLNLDFVPLTYEVSFDPSELRMPTEGVQSRRETDIDNAVIVYSQLNNLSPAQATDPALWSTLCLMYAPEYVLCRWPLKKKNDTYASHIRSHWLCGPNARSRERDNALGRLWWMGWIASQMRFSELRATVEILFTNSDYRSQLIDRRTSASAPNVLAAVLIISKEAYDAGLHFNRNKFRAFMKELNYFGLRKNLVSMDLDDLVASLKPIYHECYKSL